MSEDAKQRIMDWVKQQKKSKLYFNDLCKAVPEIKMMAGQEGRKRTGERREAQVLVERQHDHVHAPQ